MFFWRIKNCIRNTLALLLSALVASGVWGAGVSRLPNVTGARCFYLDSASSQAELAQTLSLLDLARVRGESVALSLGEEEALALIAELSATVLFIEEAAGVRSYYCYTEEIYGGLSLGDYFVNLHVAVSGEGCVVGSPIIFGSF